MAKHVTQSLRQTTDHVTGEVKQTSSTVVTSSRNLPTGLSVFKIFILLLLVVNVMRVILNTSDVEFMGFTTLLDTLANIPQPSQSINTWINSLNIETDIPALNLLGNIFLKPIQFMWFLTSGAIQLITTIGYILGSLLV